jgi:hypothetical protein
MGERGWSGRPSSARYTVHCAPFLRPVSRSLAWIQVKPTSAVEGPASHHDLDVPSARRHDGCGNLIPGKSGVLGERRWQRGARSMQRSDAESGRLHGRRRRRTGLVGRVRGSGGGVVVQEYLLFCSLTTNCSRLGTRSWHESSTPAAH